MAHYHLTPLAQSLPASVPFVGPESQERTLGRPFLARLGANESPFGPSPRAREAMAKTDLWMYGAPENHDLRHALAAPLGTSPETSIVGAGVDGLLGYLVRLFVGPGDRVVTSAGAYPTFNYHVSGFGGLAQAVPFDAQDREDLPGLIAKAQQVQAKLVYLANPDNPMGTAWHGAEIAAALADLPRDCLLVLDEAYIDCADDSLHVPVAWDDPRLIRLRTFSKVYGLAGARVGYAIAAPDLIESFHKVRNHFGMGRASQEGALAALADQDWTAEVIAQIKASREMIAAIARENGLKPLPSQTNFVAIDGLRDADFARAVVEGLISAGVFVRMPFAAPQNRCIRVSCGGTKHLDIFAKVLPNVLAELR